MFSTRSEKMDWHLRKLQKKDGCVATRSIHKNIYKCDIAQSLIFLIFPPFFFSFFLFSPFPAMYGENALELRKLNALKPLCELILSPDAVVHRNATWAIAAMTAYSECSAIYSSLFFLLKEVFFSLFFLGEGDS